MVATCTVRAIQSKLAEKEVSVSIGSIISFRPFFVTYATEKEMALCLCKLCLNARMLFEPLMKQAKKDGNECFTSLTEFFMSSLQCPKGTNGYYGWRCVSNKCKECKNVQLPSMICQNSGQFGTVDQFEIITSFYKKVDKVSGKEVEKKSTRTERVSSSITFQELYKKLEDMRKVYLMHRYQFNNDVFQWPIILATTNTYGPIFHMNFSENLSQMYKYEPQSSHFSKRQFFCIVQSNIPTKMKDVTCIICQMTRSMIMLSHLQVQSLIGCILKLIDHKQLNYFVTILKVL